MAYEARHAIWSNIAIPLYAYKSFTNGEHNSFYINPTLSYQYHISLLGSD